MQLYKTKIKSNKISIRTDIMLKLAFLIFYILKSVESVDWCEVESELCNGRSHIGCNPDQIKQIEVKHFQLIKTSSVKNLILKGHNVMRNNQASGIVQNFPPASKMQEMGWDKNLTTLAAIHVRHCNMQHDGCRATDKYPNAGQNLGSTCSTKKNRSIKFCVDRIIEGWRNELYLADVSIISNYTRTDNQIGHYTICIKDTNYACGCSVARYIQLRNGEEYDCVMMTCNYATTNIIGEPVYTVGPTGSDCDSIGKRMSETYVNLCSL